MENRIYKVTYEVATDDVEDWMEDNCTVLANGDALQAVAKAEKHARKTYAKPYEDEETGKTIRPKVEGFRLVGVHIVAEAEVV